MNSPYREPEPCDLALTDEEVALWDRAACAALGRRYANPSDAAMYADALVKERRERFGVRSRQHKSVDRGETE